MRHKHSAVAARPFLCLPQTKQKETATTHSARYAHKQHVAFNLYHDGMVSECKRTVKPPSYSNLKLFHVR